MLLINGVKFACTNCIKGHRASHCHHTERPLFPIRKKGRPPTQCTYCRHLRKTRQVHIKCICIDRQGGQSPSRNPTVAAQSVSKTVSTDKVPTLNLDGISIGGEKDNLGTTPCSDTHKPCTLTWRNPRFEYTVLSSLNKESDQLGIVFQKPANTIKPSTSQDGQSIPRRNSDMHSGSAATKDDAASPKLLSLPTLACTNPPLPIPDMTTTELDMNCVLSLAGYPETEAILPSSPTMTESIAKKHHIDTDAKGQEPDSTSYALMSLLMDALQSEFNALTPQLQSVPQYQTGCCGSTLPEFSCMPLETTDKGDSVVITITPLPRRGQMDIACQKQTIVRVATCYCGVYCTCLGCLIHGDNSFFAP